MLKRKRTLVFFCIIMVFLVEIVYQYYGSIHIIQKNNRDLSRSVRMLTRGTRSVRLNSLTDFKWDELYSFEPYVSMDTMKDIMDVKGSKFTCKSDEGLPSVVFVKDNKVVCCISGYPSDYGFSFEIPTKGKTFTMIPRENKAILNVTQKDGIYYLIYNSME